MTISKRLYLVTGLVAVIALAFSAVTLTSSLTSAGSDAAQTCDQQDEADDAAESATEEADTDNIEEECGDQNEADDADEGEDNDAQAPSGALDDGKELLPQAGITIEAAIAAAQSAATGPVGEVDLEPPTGRL